MKRRIFFWGLLGALVFPAWGQAGTLADFNGQMDVPRQTVRLAFSAGENARVGLRFGPAGQNLYQLTLNLEQVRTPFFEISSQLDFTGDLRRDTAGKVLAYEVKVKSQYTLINKKPVSDIFGQFLIRDQKIYLNSLAMETLFLQGEAEAVPPFPMRGQLQFVELPLKDVLSFFSPDGTLEAEGAVSGTLTFEGSPGAFSLRLTGSVSPGQVEGWAFRAMEVQAEGVYPKLLVRDVLITQADGHLFSATGLLDVSAPESWEKQIGAFTKAPLVARDRQTSDWTLKRVESGTKMGSTELKYRLQQKDNVQNLSSESADLIEVERKIEF